MKHTDILNHLAKTFDLKTYLEIGVQDPDNNFNKIICPDKKGVDPDPVKHQIDIYLGTSDMFFECPCSNDMFFDLIFIDGLHTAEQVKIDFENSLKRLNPGGFIVLHDCNPTEEAWTCVPRGKQKVWTGDVYKFSSTMAAYGLEFNTVDTDFGCMVIENEACGDGYSVPVPTWKEFEQNRKDLLNLITVDEFFKKY